MVVQLSGRLCNVQVRVQQHGECVPQFYSPLDRVEEFAQSDTVQGWWPRVVADLGIV